MILKWFVFFYIPRTWKGGFLVLKRFKLLCLMRWRRLRRDDEMSPGFRSSGSLCCAIWCGTGRQRRAKEHPERGDGVGLSPPPQGSGWSSWPLALGQGLSVVVAQGHLRGMGRDLGCILQQKDKTDRILEECMRPCLFSSRQCVLARDKGSDLVLAVCVRKI